MKLLYCGNCGHIFNLVDELRTCDCGQTKGQYVDHFYATYSGKDAVPLGIANTSLLRAIRNRPDADTGKGVCFEAFVIPKQCETFWRIASEP